MHQNVWCGAPRFLVWGLVFVVLTQFLGRLRIAAADQPESSKTARSESVANRLSASGVVVRQNGTPVAGAKIWLRRCNLEPITDPSTEAGDVVLATATTGEDGRFAFRDIARSSNGQRHTLIFTVQPPQGAITWKAMLEDKAIKQSGDLGRIVVKPSAQLRGRLLSSDKKPLANVRLHPTSLYSLKETADDRDGINLGHSSASPRVTTDAEGRFEIDGLPQEYFVWFQVETSKYSGPIVVAATTEEPQQPLKNETGPVPVHTGQFTAVIPKGKTLRGRVTLEDSRKPARGVSLVLSSWRAEIGYFQAETDAQGAFEIPEIYYDPSSGLTPDRLIVKSPPNSPYVGFSGEIKILKDVTEKNFVLPRGVPVKGLVQDQATEQGIPGISAEYYVAFGAGGDWSAPHEEGAENPPKPKPSAEQLRYQALDAQLEGLRYRFATARTNSLGAFTLLGLGRLGIVEIHGRAPTYWLPPKANMTHRIGPFEKYSNPNARTPLIFELHHGLTIKGRVTDLEGKPVAGARVIECARSPGSLWHPTNASVETTTDANGWYRLAGVAPDTAYTYLLVVDEPRKLKALKFVREQPYDARFKSDFYPNGQRAEFNYDRPPPKPVFDVDFQVGAAPSVTAMVMSDGKPVGAAEVMIDETPFPARPKEGEFESSFAGHSAVQGVVTTPPLQFSANIDSQGQLTVQNLLPGAEYQLRIVTDKSEGNAYVIRDLKPGEHRHLQPVQLAPTWNLTVQAVDHSGKPYPHAIFSCRAHFPSTRNSKDQLTPSESRYSFSVDEKGESLEQSLPGDCTAITLRPIGVFKTGQEIPLKDAQETKVAPRQKTIRIVVKPPPDVPEPEKARPIVPVPHEPL